MDVVVPFDARDPKTRLATTLTSEERRQFAHLLLSDVLETIWAAGGEPELLATAPVDFDTLAGGWDGDHDSDGKSALELAVDIPVTVDDRPLTEAVNDRLAGGERTAIVMADLGLVTADSLGRLFDAGEQADVVIAPGVGGGTNALVVDHESFSVDYHGCSYRDHREQCLALEATLAVVDSFRLAVDIDEPTDLVELLVHGTGRATAWLDDRFEITTDEGDFGRVTVTRRE